jgi:hypothetical protein
MVAKQYQALRTIGTIYKVLGIIAGVLTILLVLGFCGFSVLGGASLSSLGSRYGSPSFGSLFGGLLGGVIGGIFIIIYGGAISLTLYAAGELVYLLLALEENTRATAQLLQQQSGGKLSPPA